MNIAIADNQALKFDHDLVDHWRSKGHEVRYEVGASEILFQWCDLYYVNFWDNNIHYLYNWHMEHPEVKKPIIACRAIDWDVWCGLVRDQRIIDWVDHGICIAPHIERKLRAEANWGEKLHLIPCGVDTDKFTFRNSIPGFNIVLPCNEIDWVLKNVPEGIKIFGMLCKKYPELPWLLYIRGKWTVGNEYFKVYFNDLIDKLGLTGRVSFIDQPVDDYNQFLEIMDYCLVPSYKEAFSYVAAESASKGIKPILNWWYGAEEIWPKGWLYTTPDQAVNMFVRDFDSEAIRNYIVEHKNVKTMLAKYDEVLRT